MSPSTSLHLSRATSKSSTSSWLQQNWTIIAIVVGSACAVTLIASITFIVIKHRRRNRTPRSFDLEHDKRRLQISAPIQQTPRITVQRPSVVGAMLSHMHIRPTTTARYVPMEENNSFDSPRSNPQSPNFATHMQNSTQHYSPNSPSQNQHSPNPHSSNPFSEVPYSPDSYSIYRQSNSPVSPFPPRPRKLPEPPVIEGMKANPDSEEPIPTHAAKTAISFRHSIFTAKHKPNQSVDSIIDGHDPLEAKSAVSFRQSIFNAKRASRKQRPDSAIGGQDPLDREFQAVRDGFKGIGLRPQSHHTINGVQTYELD